MKTIYKRKKNNITLRFNMKYFKGIYFLCVKMCIIDCSISVTPQFLPTRNAFINFCFNYRPGSHPVGIQLTYGNLLHIHYR